MAKDYVVLGHLLSASLSPELVQEHRIRNMVVRDGDTVAILRGGFRDVEGKVTRVDRETGYIRVEGVTREKADGTTMLIPIHASKVVIRRLVLDDKRRKEILDRRAATPEPKAPEPKVEEEKPKSRRRGRRAAPTMKEEPEQKEGE